MIEIRYADINDKEFWYTLDKHLPEEEFENKVCSKRGYILSKDNKPIGLMRYNLFWDSIPFCRKLMEHWEFEMRVKGYGMVLTSTQVNENAQNFYRKMGYKDCGSLIIDIPGYEQPAELFLSKSLKNISTL